MTDHLFTTQELAAAIDHSISTVNRWRTDGLLKPARQIGRSFVYTADAVLELIDRLEKQHAERIAKMRSAFAAAIDQLNEDLREQVERDRTADEEPAPTRAFVA